MLRVLPVVPLVFLAGCGLAGTEFHPGVAAQVGDETITTRHVDEVTTNYCTAVEEITKGAPNAAGQATPNRYFSHEFASALVEKAAAEQLAEQYDVEPTAEYKSGLAQLEPQLADLDEEQKEAVREAISATGAQGISSYTDDVLTQIGEIELKDQGKNDSTADEQLTAGREVLNTWLDDHDVEVNPKYGVELGTDGQVDTDLSYAVGDTAKGGISAQADPGYTAGLSAHLVCLDYS
jgi:peptidyl-prolyl cis-trans isomerase SurA